MAYLLVIDDDDDFSSAAVTVLKSAGHEVASELTIAGGKKSIDARKPDLLVLDAMFPENDAAGFELAIELRNEVPDLKIIMLTAVNQKFPLGFSSKDIDEVHMPVDDFLEKPVDFDTLKARVDALIAKT